MASTVLPEPEPNRARLALLSLLAGFSCALGLSLLWLAIVWFNGVQPLPPAPP